MSDRTIVITTPRTGGTPFTYELAKKNGCEFINEPFILGFNPDSALKFGFHLHTASSLPESYVMHCMSGQFFAAYKDSKNYPKARYIFLERKDKWKQAISYLKLCGMAFSNNHVFGKYGTHNYNVTEDVEIFVPPSWMMVLTNLWSMYDHLKTLMPDAEVVYYEDVIYGDDLPYKKNVGMDKVSIVNIEHFERMYHRYWQLSDPRP